MASGGQGLQYFSSGEYFDEKGNTPNDAMQKYTARGNFTYSPMADLQVQWNTAYMNQFQTNSPQGNNAEGLELNVFRQNQNYFADANPDLIDRVLNQTLESQIERFTTGGTVNYAPTPRLNNRFTIGYDFSNQETRNSRPFGFFAHPDGIIHVSNYQKRILTFEYVGGYSFDLSSNVRSNFSWGGQSLGEKTRQLEGFGRGFPGAAEPTVVRNPDALPRTLGQIPLCTATTVQPGDPCRETSVYRGSNLPTQILGGYTTLRLPFGISLSTRGEYRGGHYTTAINPIAIGRSVRSPLCFDYYANEDNVQLKPDTPGLWVARCTPSLATGYSQKADYFKLRSISATIPMDFAFPDRVQNATLTLSMNNVYTWSRESPWGTYGFENFGNAGLTSEAASVGISSNERIPAPTTLRAAFRFTF